jgi:hypothetical protein
VILRTCAGSAAESIDGCAASSVCAGDRDATHCGLTNAGAEFMKRAFVIAGLLVGLGGVAAAGTIRVENGDSKTHTVELKCSGSSKTVEIRGSTTATYTFHSTSKECDIVGGTIKFPTNKLTDGQKWKIKNGEAKPN